MQCPINSAAKNFVSSVAETEKACSLKVVWCKNGAKLLSLSKFLLWHGFQSIVHLSSNYIKALNRTFRYSLVTDQKLVTISILVKSTRYFQNIQDIAKTTGVCSSFDTWGPCALICFSTSSTHYAEYL